MKCISKVILILVALSLLCGCASQMPGTISERNAAGIISGIIHGYFILLSLFCSIFADVHIYETPNTGFGYNLGFVLGVGGFKGTMDAIWRAKSN